jgi:hypothetical protein
MSHVCVLLLHHLSSERELQQQVCAFFASASPGSVLLLQCDPLAASSRRIEHAKYIVENARARAAAEAATASASAAASVESGGAGSKAAGGVHVMLLLHLPRGSDGYCLDVDRRWRHVYIDR